MNRMTLAGVLALVVAAPAAVSLLSFEQSPASRPCFAAANGAYRMSDSATANYTVRIDNGAASPSLRLQVVDDPAVADFVLVDDGNGREACQSARVRSVRIDPDAATPDVTVALSHAPADVKIYVNSTSFSEQEAAALYAVILTNSRRTGPGRALAARETKPAPR